MTKHLKFVLRLVTIIALLSLLVACSDIKGTFDEINNPISIIKDIILGTIQPEKPNTECEHEWYDASCTAPQTCSKCGIAIGNKLPHNEVIDKGVEPTCNTTGLTEGKHCSICNRILVAQTVVDALGHEIVVDAAVAPTCTATGLTAGEHCSRCDYKVAQTVVDALGHKYNSEVTSPTCEDAGYTTYTCSCGDTYTDDTVDALGHDIVIDNAVAPTCTTTGLTAGEHCSRCDYKVAQETVSALDHDIVIDNAVAPTCTTTGLTEGKHCSRCDYKVAQTVVDALDHDIVIDNAVAPTCTTTGLTEGKHCSRCDYKVAQETVSALDHDIVIDNAVAPTCTTTGLTAGEHCSRCDHKIAQTVVDALDHDIVIDNAVAPTCTTTGLTAGKHCSRCDYKVAQETVSALDHAFNFTSNFNGDFLYRVGNKNKVQLNALFNVHRSNAIEVRIEGSNVSGTYSNGELEFSGTGIVTVTVTDTTCGYSTDITLEVVDATNVTGLSGTISGNVVLLNDCGISSLTVSGRNTVYGNGFTATYSGNGQYLNNGLKQGVITVSENGTLDNLRIFAPIYPRAYLYYGQTSLGDYVQGGPSSVEGDKTRYHYQLSAVVLKGNATLTNCYIYGGRNNVFVDTGDVTIKDSILECGTVANVQIQSNSSHTVTLENVTTIQYQVNPTIGDTTKVMIGAGILVGPETNDNPTIVLKGELKQYNWVNADDKSAVSDSVAQKIIGAALDATAYNHTVNGKTASNLGIIYMNGYAASITNNTGLPYALGTISLNGINGQAYSLKNATSEQIYSDYANADRTTQNGYYTPQYKYSEDLGGQYIAEGGDEHFFREGDTINVMFPSGDTKEVDLSTLVDISKYTGQKMILNFTCANSEGEALVITNNKVTLSAADTYTITYTLTDTWFYDKYGNEIVNSIDYSWTVIMIVSLKDKSTPNAEFVFDTSKQIMGYGTKSGLEGLGKSNFQYLPFLAGLQIYDYIGQEQYLRFDGNTDFNKIAKVELTCASDNAYVTVTLIDGGVIDITFFGRAKSGSSTKTGAIKVRNNVVYYLTDGDTSATTTTWTIDNYSFYGNNGVKIEDTKQIFSNCVKGTLPSENFGTTITSTVSYDANGGDCGQTTGYATSVSTAVTLPKPSRSGYIFAGWYTATSGGSRIGGAGESYTPSGNITLYAQWGKPCDVTFNANGGSCGTASAHYNGTAITLPTATRDGYWFIGWYDAAEGGNKIGDAGATYNPAGDTTLYAHWQEQTKYTVTYNANGGSCGTASATYEGTALTLPTPTRTGYTFNGWSDGSKTYAAGASYIPTDDITLTAQWEKISYKITYSNSNTSSVNGPETAYYGDTVTVTVVYTKGQSSTPTLSSGGTVTSSGSGTNYTYKFTMPAQDVTMTIKGSGCFAEGTLITLADGTQKPIEEITYEDQLLAWDFNTGSYAVTVPSLIESHDLGEYRVINLKFADGTVTRIIVDHGFFDVETNNFVFIDEENVDSYVGHSFIKATADGSYESVELIGYEVTVEQVRYYTIQTAIYNNCIAENMLTLTSPPEMLENDGWFDYFEIGEGMKYDEEKMQADIEKYGLYTYEEFADYVTYEQFIAFNGPYLKVLVGRGVVTYDQIIELISMYVPQN